MLKARVFKAGYRLTPAKILFFFNISLIFFIFLLGLDSKAFRPAVTPRDLAYYNGQFLSLSGRVCEEADLDYKSRRLTVCVDGETSGQVLVTTNLYPVYDYGDFLKVSGELRPPPAISGFDYAAYLARYDIYSVMYYPKIERELGRLAYPQYVYRGLLNFKQYIKGLVDSSLPEPEAGLADALLLGYRRTVMREDLDIFARVGLSHMIAISGSHITILSAMIVNFVLMLGFSRKRSLRLVFIFLVIYPLITGLAASAVRSALMGGLAFLAFYHGRSSSLIKALAFSGALMLALNPRLLRDDIGFQLSFLAILGIIYLYPIGERFTRRILDKLGWKRRLKQAIKIFLDTVNLTLVSQIVILPVALINFKQLSLIAPLANVLVLWTFPLLLASLIISVGLSAFLPTASILWFLLAHLLLRYIFVVSDFLARPGWAAVEISNFTWLGGAVYYLILALAVIVFRKISKI